MEKAGIRGPGVREAVEAAGMDPQKFWSLAYDGEQMGPPPGGPPPGGRPFSSPNKKQTRNSFSE